MSIGIYGCDGYLPIGIGLSGGRFVVQHKHFSLCAKLAFGGFRSITSEEMEDIRCEVLIGISSSWVCSD